MSYYLNIVIVHLKNTTEFDRVESCPGRGLARAWPALAVGLPDHRCMKEAA
jgi:hypothetical protein